MKSTKSLLVLACGFAPFITSAQLIPASQPTTSTQYTAPARHDSMKHVTLGIEGNTMGSSPYVDFNSVLFYGYTGYSGEAGTTKNKSFSVGLRSCIDLKNNFSLKLRAGYRNSNVSVTITDTSNKSQVVLNESQPSYYFVVGCQQNIRINKFTHLHVGLDFDLTYYADLDQTLNYTETNQSYNYNYQTGTYYYTTITTTITEKYTTPGGVTFGVGPALGFDFKLSKSLSLGSEATIALLYETLGGKQTFTETYTTNSPNYSPPTSSQPFNFSLTTSGWTDSGVIASVYLQLTL